MQHAVEKTFLVAQPVQPIALTSKVACYQSRIISGGLNRRKPAEIARRDPPPEGRSVQPLLAPTGTNGKQSEVSSMSARHCTIAKGRRLHARPV